MSRSDDRFEEGRDARSTRGISPLARLALVGVVAGVLAIAPPRAAAQCVM